jgi:hypothetical protein
MGLRVVRTVSATSQPTCIKGLFCELGSVLAEAAIAGVGRPASQIYRRLHRR